MNLLESIGASAWVSGFRMVTCAHEPCSRWLTQRYLTVRKVGVTMGDLWYCSYGCFRAAAVAEMAKLLAAGSPSSTYAARMSLGLALVSRELLTNDQYKTAVDAQRDSGEEMGELVVRLGFVTEKQVTAIRAMQWGCPVFAHSSAMAETGVHIPPTLARLSSMVPLHFSPGTKRLLVGFVHGIEYGSLYALEQIIGCTTQPCFITPTEFRAAMQRQSEQGTTEELRFEDRSGPVEMGRILCDYGVLVDADEVIIKRCRNFLWARLTSGLKATDLLFKIN